jgi:hypothetical protein
MYATGSTHLWFHRHVLKGINYEALRGSILSSLLSLLLDLQIFPSAPCPQMLSVIFFLSVRSQVSYLYKSVGKIIDFRILCSLGRKEGLRESTHCLCACACLCVSLWQFVNQLTEAWYGCYTIRRHPQVILHNFVQSIVTEWRMREHMTWKRH